MKADGNKKIIIYDSMRYYKAHVDELIELADANGSSMKPDLEELSQKVGALIKETEEDLSEDIIKSNPFRRL